MIENNVNTGGDNLGPDYVTKLSCTKINLINQNRDNTKTN
jgi:hypothetical protein